MQDPLSIFHPHIRRWFSERVGEPTDVQVRAWPEIAAGRHVLITAPTGSGKTLAAFLWAINQLVSGKWPGGQVSVLYVSPLKALNNDIQRNLLGPLSELRAWFANAGEPFPGIDVQTRSGDTEPSARRRMLRHPPEILITTPESLNILLTSRNGQGLFRAINTVILDEIHGVVATKRGTHTISAVDRVVLLAGEFQRIALSATVKPVRTIADFVGGYRLIQDGDEPKYEKRPVSIVESDASKELDIRVRFPEIGPDDLVDGSRWPALAAAFKDIVDKNRSTLLFTNSRRLCERITLLINELAGNAPGGPIAYSHHGSLSREIRAVVEQRLKNGELAAIVATNSLELGIDIGALDEVVLVQSPFSVSSAIQRIGRAGHRVNAVSKGVLFPTHGRDFVDGAVLARCVARRDLEPIHPVARPLDVLAQVIVSMVSVETWDIDRLYAFLRTTWPYHELSRRQYDLVLDMLAGRYAESRLRALQPIVSIDKLDNTIRSRGLVGPQLIYRSGGTIADRGYYNLRKTDTNAKIGELDEEFVWERSLGDSFTLGTQIWKIDKVTHNDVFVTPAVHSGFGAPFWKAEELNRDFHLSERTADFLEQADGHLAEREAFVERLMTDYCLEPLAAEELVDYLKRQRAATGVGLPHRHHFLVERCADVLHDAECTQVILHTLWGGALNRPYAVALAQAWEAKFGHRIEVYANNDCIALMAPHEEGSAEIADLVSPENLDTLLRKGLEHTGFFGARFRECAGVALQLPRQSFRKRTPLWLNRLRSKKLLDTVMRYADFPILTETWRTCLEDEFDLPNLKRMLAELQDGAIRITDVKTISLSPFAQSMAWRQTNQYMYMDDTPMPGGASRLSNDILQEAVHSAELRPQLDPGLVRTFQQKAQRIYPGYAPSAPEDLLDWVKERLLIPDTEWTELLDAVERDAKEERTNILEPIAEKLAHVRLENGNTQFVVALESLPRITRTFGLKMEDFVLTPLAPPEDDIEPPPGHIPEPEDGDEILEAWISEWLRFYGPLPKACLVGLLPATAGRLQDALESLLGTGSIVVDHLTRDAHELEVCDAENLEILLRLTRAAARPAFEPLAVEHLPLFLAHHQGVTQRETDEEGLPRALAPLMGYPFSAGLLESEYLPARIASYDPASFDGLMQESDLLWFGCGDKKAALAFSDALEVYASHEADKKDETEDNADVAALLPHPQGRFPFSALLESTGLASGELTRRLWKGVWEGRVSNDSFAALRKGIESRFKASEMPKPKRGRLLRRGAFNRWKTSRPFEGNWYVLPESERSVDLLEEEENKKERVRQLLERYGILFRELLQNELPGFRWGALFRTLRLMELSGEILAGCFFDGVPGLQFISPSAFRSLQEKLPEDAVFWLNAADPASLCGVGLSGLKAGLPKRLPTTHLVYHGSQLVLVSQRNGQRLDIRVPPEHPRLADYVSVLHHLLSRRFRPLPSIAVERINGAPATESPYVEVLRQWFETDVGPNAMTIWRKSGPG